MDVDCNKLKKTIIDTKELYIVRRDAISELARSGDSGALDTILSVRGDREKIIRRKIAELLCEFDNDRSRAALCEFLSDADDDVKRNAIRSLKKIGDASCLAPLEKTIEDKSWFVKRSAEDVLKDLKKKFPDGPAAPPAPLGKARGQAAEAAHKPRVRQRLPVGSKIPSEVRDIEEAEPGARVEKKKEEKKKKPPTRLTATAASVLADSATAEKKSESLSDLQSEIAALRKKHADMLQRHEVDAAARTKEAQSLKSPQRKTESRTEARRAKRPERPKTRRERKRPARQAPSARPARTISTPGVRTVEPARRDRGTDKTCPSCGEKVKQHHRVCLYCGHTFGRTARKRAERQVERGLRAPHRRESRGLTGKFMLVLTSDGKIAVDDMADVLQKSRGVTRGDAVKMLTRSSGILGNDLHPAEVKRLSSILERAPHRFFVTPADQRHMRPKVVSIRRGKVGRSGPDLVLQDSRTVKVGWNDVLLVTCGLIRPGKEAFAAGKRRGSGSLRFVMDFFIREPYCIARVVRKMPNLSAMQKLRARSKSDYFEELAREVLDHGIHNRISRGVHHMSDKGFRGNWSDLTFEDEIAFTNYSLWLLEVLEHETVRSGQLMQVLVPHLSSPRFDVSENPEHHVWREHVRDRRRHHDYRDIVRKDNRRDRKQIGWGSSNDLIDWSELFSGSGAGTTGRVIVIFMVILGLMTFFVVMGAMCK
ncbi:MAG: hypothetical protein E3J72_19625 [Planctomycetota bacterium]|nr:MAG: hypothetical protein E3J72_19625 [Planctomycetota bacterium]